MSENKEVSWDEKAILAIKAEADSMCKLMGITDSEKVDNIYAQAIGHYLANKNGFKNAITSLGFMERFWLGLPAALFGASVVLTVAAAASALSGSQTESTSTETTTSSDNPFASIDPVKATPRPVKSAI